VAITGLMYDNSVTVSSIFNLVQTNAYSILTALQQKQKLHFYNVNLYEVGQTGPNSQIENLELNKWFQHDEKRHSNGDNEVKELPQRSTTCTQ